jgi:hypothetical protein
MESTLQQLKQVFPEQDSAYLRSVLEQNSNDLDGTIDYLLSSNEENKSSQVSDLDTTVSVMEDIFPGVNRDRLVDALRKFNLDIDLASEYILSSDSSSDLGAIQPSARSASPEEDEVDPELLSLLLADPKSTSSLQTPSADGFRAVPAPSSAVRPEGARAYRPPSAPAPSQSDARPAERAKTMDVAAAEFSPADGFQTVSRRTARPAASSGGGSGFAGCVRLVVLVGLPGSGKSTLARRFAARGWRIVCQDELGSRAACEEAVDRALQDGAGAVVDRTNIDAEQRAHWLRIAARHRLPAAAAACVVVSAPRAACERRVLARRGHPTLPPDSGSVGVVRRFAGLYRAPDPQEGFGRILVIRSGAGGGGGGVSEDEAALEALLAP